MGIENVNSLKPSFTVEQFPDGTYEVPLIDVDGETIGTATVAFKEGNFPTGKTVIDEFKSLTKLGVEMTFVHKFDPVKGDVTVMVARKL